MSCNNTQGIYQSADTDSVIREVYSKGASNRNPNWEGVYLEYRTRNENNFFVSETTGIYLMRDIS